MQFLMDVQTGHCLYLLHHIFDSSCHHHCICTHNCWNSQLLPMYHPCRKQWNRHNPFHLCLTRPTHCQVPCIILAVIREDVCMFFVQVCRFLQFLAHHLHINNVYTLLPFVTVIPILLYLAIAVIILVVSWWRTISYSYFDNNHCPCMTEHLNHIKPH